VTIQSSSSDGVTLKIEGKIAGPNVSALSQAWRELAPSLGQKKLKIDLRGVTHADGNGRNLLGEIHATTGAEFVADTPLTKYFAEQAQQHVPKI
jgi:ABC-type transporter Mla MlaB component